MRGLLRPIITLISGSAIAQLITLVLSPVLTRLYSPDDFGMLAVYSSLVSVFGVTACLRLDLAIVVPKSDSQAHPIFRTAFWLSALLGVTLFVTALAFGRQLADIFGQPRLASYLPLVGIAVFSSGVFQSIVQWNARTNQFRNVATAQLGRSITTNTIQLAAGLLSIGSGGLVAGQFVGQLSASTRLALRPDARRLLRWPSLVEIQQVIGKYREFALFGTPQAMLNALSQNLPNLIFAAFISPAAAGFYALTHRVLGAPVRLVGESLRQALYPRLARALEDGSALALSLRLIMFMGLLVVIPVALIAFAGPALFSAVFSEEWLEAGYMARYLIFVTAMALLNIPSVCLIQLLRMQKLYLIFEIVYFVARVSALLVGVLVGDALTAVSLYSLVAVIFNFILIIIPLFALKRKEATGK